MILTVNLSEAFLKVTIPTHSLGVVPRYISDHS